jgi:hypothetical protein
VLGSVNSNEAQAAAVVVDDDDDDDDDDDSRRGWDHPVDLFDSFLGSQICIVMKHVKALCLFLVDHPKSSGFDKCC